MADGLYEKMYVYVIKSKENNRLYIGVAENIALRLQQHNSGNCKSTKPYVPWELVRTEEYKDKILSLKREKFLKSGKGRRALKNLLGLSR
jgi:putative endonuclease